MPRRALLHSGHPTIGWYKFRFSELPIQIATLFPSLSLVSIKTNQLIASETALPVRMPLALVQIRRSFDPKEGVLEMEEFIQSIFQQVTAKEAYHKEASRSAYPRLCSRTRLTMALYSTRRYA